MLDYEHKDELITYDKKLGMNFTKANPKSEICLAILDNRQKLFDKDFGYQ